MTQDISYNTFSNKGETRNIVKTIAQLKKAISQNNDMKFFNKLFRVMYGVFDEQYKWSKNLEKTFMTKYNYKYAEKSNSKHNERDKGCFERIAHDVKTQIVKELQRHGKKSNHGLFLTLKIDTKSKKRIQRKKSKFYSTMVKGSQNYIPHVEESGNDDSTVTGETQQVSMIK